MIPLPFDSAHKILIYGAGLTGRSFCRILEKLGKSYDICDDNPNVVQKIRQDYDRQAMHSDQVNPSDYDLILTSPGALPSTKIFHTAVPVWGDWELAWRLNAVDFFGPRKKILAITGTNGKTTTTMMTHAILSAANIPVVMCGNVGIPVLDGLLDYPDAQIIVGELSSFQLHYAPSFIPDAGVILNIDPDHLDWHGSLDAYIAAKQRVLNGEVAIIGSDDPIASTLKGTHRTIGITLGSPEVNQLGIDENAMIIDRAFSAPTMPEVLIARDKIHPATPAGWIDALGAIALVRTLDIPTEPITQALSSFVTAAHRGQIVASRNGVDFVDNSKATNPHAAISAINDICAVYPASRIIWIAGGQLKGADISQLITFAASRISSVIIFGVDGRQIVEAFLQHASDIPVFWLVSEDDSSDGLDYYSGRFGIDHKQLHIERVSGIWQGAHVMEIAVHIARQIAQRGDVVLLAPAAASLDLFSGYGQRGDIFAQLASA